MIADLNPYPAYKDSGVPLLGEVPEHWEVGTLRRWLRPYDGIKIGPFGSQMRLEHMTSSGYKVFGQANVIASDFFRGTKFVDQKKYDELSACRVQPGDLVMTMMGTSGRCAMVPQTAAAGIMDSHLLRLRTSVSAAAPFFALILDEGAYVKEQIGVAGKGSIMHGLNSSIVKDLALAIPPLPEQSTILRFLDHADRRIRRYISAKKKLIALLNEQKQVIIHRAVTRGLGPDAGLKPSGVEWLGEVPEWWSIQRTKDLFRLRTQKSGERHGLELLSIYTHVGVRPRKELEERGNKATTTDDYWIVRKGDIIVNKLLAWMGAIGVSNYEGVTSPAYDILMPIRELVPEFYHHLFRTKLYLQQFKQRSRGIMGMRLRLYFDQLGQIPLVVPPIEEQSAIVDFFINATAELDRTIESAQREINLLREYRTRLIADVVTGKLDVREAAARLPVEAEESEPLEVGEVLREEDGEEADLDAVSEEAVA
jgi:type I restriction enzyme, S subunit